MEDEIISTNQGGEYKTRYYSVILTLGILGYILSIVYSIGISIYGYQFYSVFLIFSFIYPILCVVALVSFVREKRGRFWGAFVFTFILSMITRVVTILPFTFDLSSFLLGFYVLGLLEGYSLWTCREESRQPTLTVIIAFYFAFNWLSFLPNLFGIYYDTIILSKFISVLIILLFYFEIRKPDYAKIWDRQQNTMSPQA